MLDGRQHSHHHARRYSSDGGRCGRSRSDPLRRDHGDKSVYYTVNILLLILVCLMDGNTLIIMLGAILAMAVGAVGVDPIHFGVIMVINVTIGALTPPVGVV